MGTTATALRLAGEIAAWSAGVGDNDDGDVNDVNDNGNDVNDNGVEKLEGRPAPVTDRKGVGAAIGFADRI
ncbi:MAG: hypothetical protein Q8T11_17565 [Elusimicrobiota bacterium]|nr:hypothetical protein [Elusimicrobiota bacterium]